MAYCNKCGAYIPDGQSVCLACGYDPEAEKSMDTRNETTKTGQQAAYQYSRNNEEMRRRLDEQRRRTQEQNRQWAEQEKQRREEQAAREQARREQQERDRAWAQEEYERRQQEKQSTRSAFDPQQETGTGRAQAGEGNKALAAFSYLSIFFAVPFIFAPQDEYAKYHAKQGLKLFIFGILADLLTSFIGLGWAATLLRLYLIYKGMTNALNGKKEPLPYIGDIGEK